MLKQDTKANKEADVKYVKKVAPAKEQSAQSKVSPKSPEHDVRARMGGPCVPVAGG